MTKLTTVMSNIFFIWLFLFSFFESLQQYEWLCGCAGRFRSGRYFPTWLHQYPDLSDLDFHGAARLLTSVVRNDSIRTAERRFAARQAVPDDHYLPTGPQSLLF